MKKMISVKQSPVNIPDGLYFPFPAPDSLNPATIRVNRITPHLDRILINILYDPVKAPAVYDEILHDFLSGFKTGQTYKLKAKNLLIREFEYGGSRIQLLRYYPPSPATFFSVAICDAVNEVQDAVRDIIYSALPYHGAATERVKISQLEFALDFYPADPRDLGLLTRLLSYSTVLKYSRAGSFRSVKSTTYQGNKGDVRTGRKGLRIYPKPKNNSEYVRLELQCNRRMIRKHHIDLLTLPISPDHIDVLNHVDFRRGLDSESVDKLTTVVMHEKFPVLKKGTIRTRFSSKRRIDRWKVRRRAFRSQVSRIAGDYSIMPPIPDLREDRPVAEQISKFKALKKSYGFNTLVNQVFPSCNIFYRDENKA